MRWLSVVVALAATAAAPLSGPQAPRGDDHVQVLAVNDVHGALEPPSGDGGVIGATPAGGAAYLATHLRRLRAGHANTITVGAGDLIGGSPLESARYGDAPIVAALDAMDLRVSAMGNHELDDGVDALLALQERARLRWLAANTLRDGVPLLPAFSVEEVGGHRIGFIGLTLKNTPLGVAPGGTDGLTFADEAQTANRYAAQLRADGADAVFLLLHQGGAQSSEDPNACEDFGGPVVDVVAGLSDDVDAVATAHTHNAYVCEMAGKVVASAASDGRLVTDWDLAFTDGELTDVDARNVIVTRDVAPDPAVQEIVDSTREAVAPLADRVVGRLAEPIDREHLGTVIADAHLAAGRELGADVGLTNRAGIRSDVAAGDVTFGEAFDVLPFSHDVVVRSYTGAQLRAVMAQQDDRPSGGTADLGRSSNLADDGRTIDGRPVADDDHVEVAMNRFLAEGGDGFSALEAGTPPLTGPKDVDALATWLGATTGASRPARRPARAAARWHG